MHACLASEQASVHASPPVFSGLRFRLFVVFAAEERAVLGGPTGDLHRRLAVRPAGLLLGRDAGVAPLLDKEPKPDLQRGRGVSSR